MVGSRPMNDEVSASLAPNHRRSSILITASHNLMVQKTDAAARPVDLWRGKPRSEDVLPYRMARLSRHLAPASGLRQFGFILSERPQLDLVDAPSASYAAADKSAADMVLSTNYCKSSICEALLWCCRSKDRFNLYGQPYLSATWHRTDAI